jgi:hypothetical protein
MAKPWPSQRIALLWGAPLGFLSELLLVNEDDSSVYNVIGECLQPIKAAADVAHGHATAPSAAHSRWQSVRQVTLAFESLLLGFPRLICDHTQPPVSVELQYRH